MIKASKKGVEIEGSIVELCADLGVLFLVLNDEGVLTYELIRRILDVNESKDTDSEKDMFAMLGAALADKVMTDAENDSKGDGKCPPHMFWMVEPFNPLE